MSTREESHPEPAGAEEDLAPPQEDLLTLRLTCPPGEVHIVFDDRELCTCEVQAKCSEPNYSCRTFANTRICSCDDQLCPPDQECSDTYSQQCLPAECGRKRTCTSPGTFCDPYVKQCYPANGSCRVDLDCPRFDTFVSARYALACVQGFCSLGVRVPRVPGTQDLPTMTIDSPRPGAVFGGEPVFRWSSPSAASIALVLTAPPADVADLLHHAIWGRAVPAGAAGVAAWGEGAAIVDGTWLLPAPPIPRDQTLYLVVQALRQGKLVALSGLVPFRIGSGFPQVGQPCGDDGILPGSCASPTVPLICHKGQCQKLCASHRDCDVGRSCGPLVISFASYRVCD